MIKGISVGTTLDVTAVGKEEAAGEAVAAGATGVAAGAKPGGSGVVEREGFVVAASVGKTGVCSTVNSRE